MQLNKVTHSVDYLKLFLCSPAAAHVATSLCHSLLRHTIMQLLIFCISFGLFVIYAALIIYYAIGWKSIPLFKAPDSCQNVNAKQAIRISVIIPARNEEQNIGACLNSILKQTYPLKLYEVIVVDDHSADKTAEIVSAYGGNIKLLSLKNNIPGKAINSYKKKAIEIAVAQCTGEMIITTDADCIVSENWLQTINSFQQRHDAVFLAMPVSFIRSRETKNIKQKLLKIFQSLDFMTLQGITGASVHTHVHSMCNGANLAYSKKAFEKVGGFKGIDAIASGDDMLLMHKIYRQYPQKVFFLKSTEVIVQTQPVKTIRDFFNQRIRWASKADKYDDKRIFAVLLLVYLFNVLLMALPIMALFSNFHFSLFTFYFSLWNFWLILLCFKTIVEMIFLYPVAKFFFRQHLLLYFPFMQPFHICYTIIAGWLGKFGSYQWKGRKVK